MVDVSMGYNCALAWQVETVFGENPVLADPANMGIITDITVNSGVERADIYGIGSQTRIHDPILKHNYDVTFTALWQEAATDTVYEFINDLVGTAVEGTNRKSYCFRLQAKPDGSTLKYLHLVGVTVSSFKVNCSLGEKITVEVTAQAKGIYLNDWTVISGAAIPVLSATVPAVYHGSDWVFNAAFQDIEAELQSWSIDVNYSPIRIDSYNNTNAGRMALQAQGGIEITFSGSCYGDNNTMGTGGILADLTGDVQNTIDFGCANGGYVFQLVGASYNSVNTPIKEKELVVIDFEGKANSITLV